MTKLTRQAFSCSRGPLRLRGTVFHEVDGAGHIFLRPKHNQDAVRAVTAFLANRKTGCRA